MKSPKPPATSAPTCTSGRFGPEPTGRALAVGEHVAEVAGDGRAERDRQPDHVRVHEAAQHFLRPGDEGEADERAERQGAAEDDERRRVHRVLLEVRRRDRMAQSSGSGGSHRGSVGRTAGGPIPVHRLGDGRA
jgi:hypothetical protein